MGAMGSSIGKFARRNTADAVFHLIESDTEHGVFTHCGRYMAWTDKGGRKLTVVDATNNVCRQCGG